MNEQPFDAERWIATTHFNRHRPLLPELTAITYADLSTDQQFAVYTSLSDTDDTELANEAFDFFTDNLTFAD